MGMNAETQAHLFEPFFTTKEQGKGTGLGLSTVYGIVNQSGGHISVTSEPGHGTAICVYLPRADDVEALPPSPPRVAGRPETTHGAGKVSDDVPARRQTVLLVEDAKRVREVVREILEMNGYDVLEAPDGAEALRISSRHQAPIHLMVTDVIMPQMSGRELAQRLLALRPDMRVLYMSGYADDDIVRHGVLGTGMAFIAKPFTPDSLAAKVRAIMETPAGANGPTSPPLDPVRGMSMPR